MINATNLPMKRLKKIGLWLAGILLALGILGGLAAPPLVRSVLVDQLSQLLHRPVSIDAVHINPYALSASVSGFAVQDGSSGQALLRFEELYINLSTASLWNRAPVLEEIRLKAPQLKLVRLDAQRYNISDLIAQFMKPDDGGPPARFSLNNIHVIDGRVDFDDQPYGQKHVVDAINLTLPFISSLPYYADKYMEPGFSARVNGSPIALTGKTKPFSETRETIIDWNEDNLDLTKYIEYAPLELKVKLASGLLDSHLSLSFSQQKNASPRIGLAGTAALKNVVVNKPDGDWLLKFARFDTVLRSFDAGKRSADITSISLIAPEVNLVRNKAGELDLVALLSGAGGAKPAAAPPPAPAAPSAPPFAYSVGEARLINGHLVLHDESVAPAFSGEVKAISVVAKNLASDGKQPAEIDASLITDADGHLQANGKLALKPLAAEGKFALTGIRPKSYAPYYHDVVLLDVEDGTVEVAGDYRYAQSETGSEFSLTGLQGKLDNWRLQQRGEKADLFTLPMLQISSVDVDSGKQTISVGEIKTQNARLNILRNAKGELNLASLTPERPGAKPAPAPAAKPWTIALKKLDLSGYTVNFEDRTPATPAKYFADNVAFTLENFSTAKDSKATTSLNMRVNKRGTFQASGTVSVDPIATQLKVDASNVDLVALQPYFAQYLKITLVGGAAQVKGALNFHQQGTKPQFGFDGDLGVTGLRSIDKANASDFLKWKSLNIRGIKSRGMPLDMQVADITLKDFYSRLIITADGKLNVQQILVHAGETAAAGTDAPQQTPPASKPPAPPDQTAPAKTQPSAEPATPDYKVKIGGVNLSGGTVDFSDRFIRPNYSAKLTEIGGTIATLSSDPSTRAEVKLAGKVNTDAPLDITGSINPLGKTLFLDLAATAKDIELSPLTPYSAKYAGYGIEKGKLSLDVKYHIEDNKLTADNKIFLDQLTFGAKVESPDATKLPVLLAVALLKDRNGNIDINLPVSGSLDDPQFSIGSLIIKVIINLLVKAATSPFALIGAMFGGGEELNQIEFDPGRTAITAAAETRLKTVAKALVDRPALKLEITGRASAAEDGEPAKKVALERKMRAQKLASGAKEGAAADEDDSVKIAPEEYPKLLEAVYKQEKFSKPKNLIGFNKSLPPEEMEKLILANTKMSDEDLTELATARARAVRDWLVDKGQVPAERVFLVASKLDGGSGEKASAKGSRVDLSLK